MQVNITFRGMESTDSLKNYTQERVEHISRYLDRAAEANVVLSLERYLHHADVTIHAGPFVLRGKHKGDDMYRSIEQAVDRIEKQARRYKSKMRTLKHRHAAHHNQEALEQIKVRHNIFVPPTSPEQEEAESWTQGPKIIKSNELIAHPMTVEEAVMELDLRHNDFLVFVNSQSKETCVVYRRDDGHYGLIETGAQR
ncbi:MAG: ribosome hibernation-promoting factor, HPF/YfiA family [Myxococcales bacterium]